MPTKTRPQKTAKKTEYQRIKVDPAMVELAEAIRNSPKSKAAISREVGVSVSCIRNWETRTTKRPQNITMEFVARAVGLQRSGWEPLR